MIELM